MFGKNTAILEELLEAGANLYEPTMNDMSVLEHTRAETFIKNKAIVDFFLMTHYNNVRYERFRR